MAFAAWSHRKKITVNAAEVAGDLTDVQLYVKILVNDEIKKAQADGDDFLFATDGGTQLPHEIVFFDGTNGDLYAVFKADFISGSTNTDFWLYYGNAAAADQQDVPNTWPTAEFRAVWHLNEASGTRFDSTSNNNDLAETGTPPNVNGKLYKGIDMGEDGDYCSIADASQTDLDVGATDYGVSMILHQENLSQSGRSIYSKRNGGDGYHTWFDTDTNDNGLEINHQGGGTYGKVTDTSGDPPINAWALLYPQKDSEDRTSWKIAIDDAVSASYTEGGSDPNGSADNSVDFMLGRRDTTQILGLIEEVHFEKVIRSANWIDTKWKNYDAAGFFTIGAEEANSNGDVALTAAGTGVGTGAGALEVEPELVAAGTGSLTGAGAAEVEVQMISAGTGSLTGSAALFTEEVFLTASGTGSLTGAAVVDVEEDLGAAAGVGSLTGAGALTVVEDLVETVVWSTETEVTVEVGKEYAWLAFAFREGFQTGDGVIKCTKDAHIVYGHLETYGVPYPDGSARWARGRVRVSGGTTGTWTVEGVTGHNLSPYNAANNPVRPQLTVEQTDDVGTHHASVPGDWAKLTARSSEVHEVWHMRKRVGDFVLEAWDTVHSNSASRRLEVTLTASNPVEDTPKEKSFRYAFQRISYDVGAGPVDLHFEPVSNAGWEGPLWANETGYLGDAQKFMTRAVDSVHYSVPLLTLDVGWGEFQSMTRIPDPVLSARATVEADAYVADTNAAKTNFPEIWDGRRYNDGGVNTNLIAGPYNSASQTGPSVGFEILPPHAWLAIHARRNDVIHALLDNVPFYGLLPHHFRELNGDPVLASAHPNTNTFHGYRYGAKPGSDPLGKPDDRSGSSLTYMPTSADHHDWVDHDVAHTVMTELQVAYMLSGSYACEQMMQDRIESLLMGFLALNKEYGLFQDRGTLGRAGREFEQMGRLLGRTDTELRVRERSTADLVFKTQNAASVGEQYAFDAATRQLQRSQGSFLGEGRQLGDRLIVAGTGSNDKTFVVESVATTHVVLREATVVDEGPLTGGETFTFYVAWDAVGEYQAIRARAAVGLHANPESVWTFFDGHSLVDGNGVAGHHTALGHYAIDAAFRATTLPAELEQMFDAWLEYVWRENPPDAPTGGWRSIWRWLKSDHAQWEDPRTIQTVPFDGGWGSDGFALWSGPGLAHHLAKGVIRAATIAQGLVAHRAAGTGYFNDGAGSPKFDYWAHFVSQNPIVGIIEASWGGVGVLPTEVTVPLTGAGSGSITGSAALDVEVPLSAAGVGSLIGAGQATTVEELGAAAGSGSLMGQATLHVADDIDIVIDTTPINDPGPLLVYFDASGTTSPGVTKPFHHLTYVWDFGDPGSRHPTFDGGPAALHVFDYKGSDYTVTLTVTKTNLITGVKTEATKQITVSPADPDAHWAGKTLVFSTGAIDPMDPELPPNPTLHPNTATLGEAIALWPTDVQGRRLGYRLLFKRGDSVEENETVSNHDVNVAPNERAAIGAWGAGTGQDATYGMFANDPVINCTTALGQHVFNVTGVSMGLSVSNLHYVESGAGNRSGPFNNDGSNGRMENVLFRHCVVDGLGTGYGASHDVADFFALDANDNVAMVDSKILNAGGRAATVGGHRMALWGCKLQNTGGSHTVRATYMNRGLLCFNEFSGYASGLHAIKLHNDATRGRANYSDWTEKVIIAYNRFVGGTSEWTSAYAPQNGALSEYMRDVIDHGNEYVTTAGNTIAIYNSAIDFTCRNTRFIAATATANEFLCIATERRRDSVDEAIQKTVSGTEVYHCQRHNPGTETHSSRDVLVAGPEAIPSKYSGSIIGHNNVHFIQASADKRVVAWTSTNEAGNVVVDPLFTDPSSENWALQAGSPALGVGVWTPVLRDITGGLRPLGDAMPDAGALESALSTGVVALMASGAGSLTGNATLAVEGEAVVLLAAAGLGMVHGAGVVDVETTLAAAGSGSLMGAGSVTAQTDLVAAGAGSLTGNANLAVENVGEVLLMAHGAGSLAGAAVFTIEVELGAAASAGSLTGNAVLGVLNDQDVSLLAAGFGSLTGIAQLVTVGVTQATVQGAWSDGASASDAVIADGSPIHVHAGTNVAVLFTISDAALQGIVGDGLKLKAGTLLFKEGQGLTILSNTQFRLNLGISDVLNSQKGTARYMVQGTKDDDTKIIAQGDFIVSENLLLTP